MDKYDHKVIEKKWQDKWNKEKVYEPDLKKAKKPFYNLMMFPYPSAEGLHAGNMFAFTGSDVYGRFMRMQGYTVFEPIGLDGFGIHSENFALKMGKSPQAQAKISEKKYYQQLEKIGNGFAWSNRLETCDIDYYRWTQWIFVQLFKAGLAYQKEAPVNFCPACRTVIADEQVINGRCERCKSEVEQRNLKQWFFKITKYADRLLEGHKKINWSTRVITAQKNWIGKSEGAEIVFHLRGGRAFTSEVDSISVFTTRPDTLPGATFLAVAPDSDWAKYAGKEVVNPATRKEIPVLKADYVLSDYGTGAIMGVPAHDERDLLFAKEKNLPVVEVEPYQLTVSEIEKKGWGKKAVSYHLRDWLISRQRYWGPPIPIIHCPHCGPVAVPEEELPVELPDIKDFQPEGSGKGPLANHPEFYAVACPECGRKARRETDVSDTFLDSSWYFLRYPSTRSARSGQVPFDKEITRTWLPVDLYFGGAEHSVLHLMYSRFITMALHDLGYLEFQEPFPRFFAHGLMIKDGAKMSKSRGNVVNPDDYIAKFGADTLRLYLMFMGPMDGYPDFRDTGIEGMARFVKRLWKLFNSSASPSSLKRRDLLRLMHQTIKKVGEDIQEFKYNTAISAMMILVNYLEEKGADEETLKTLCLLIAPFAPHLAEEVWVNVLGQQFSVHQQAWPKYDPKLIQEEETEIVIQVNGKARGQLKMPNAKTQMLNEVQESAKKEVAKWLEGKKIKKVIFVPGRLINFVV